MRLSLLDSHHQRSPHRQRGAAILSSELDSLWNNYNLDWINLDPGYSDIHRRDLHRRNNDWIDLDEWRRNNNRVDSDSWNLNRHWRDNYFRNLDVQRLDCGSHRAFDAVSCVE